MEGPLRRLATLELDLLRRVGEMRIHCGDARGAVEAAERGIAVDDLNETFWRIALEGEGMLGARDAVIRRYKDLVRRLDERLGLTPSSETRALYLGLLGPDCG